MREELRARDIPGEGVSADYPLITVPAEGI